MTCSTCQWRRSNHRGYYCYWTAASVPPYLMEAGQVGAEGQPTAVPSETGHELCALTLDTLLYSSRGRSLAAGILNTIAAQGLLFDLMDCYAPGHRELLIELTMVPAKA